MMWSISNVPSSYSWGMRQYSQRLPARRQTSLLSARSMPGSVCFRLAVAGAMLEGTPGFGLEDAQQAADAAVGFDLRLVVVAQRPGAGPGGESLHTFLVRPA